MGQKSYSNKTNRRISFVWKARHEPPAALWRCPWRCSTQTSRCLTMSIVNTSFIGYKNMSTPLALQRIQQTRHRMYRLNPIQGFFPLVEHPTHTFHPLNFPAFLRCNTFPAFTSQRTASSFEANKRKWKDTGVLIHWFVFCLRNHVGLTDISERKILWTATRLSIQRWHVVQYVTLRTQVTQPSAWL